MGVGIIDGQNALVVHAFAGLGFHAVLAEAHAVAEAFAVFENIVFFRGVDLEVGRFENTAADGEAEVFADYSQWEIWQRSRESKASVRITPETSTRPAPAKKKLSYIEAREFAAIEERITEAEQELQARLAALEDPAIASDGPRLLATSAKIEEARKAVDALYARWSELEQKQS